MKIKSIIQTNLILLTICFLIETAVLSAESKSREILNDYIVFALKESAELESAFNLYQANKEKAPQVSALPDPKVSYSYFINSIETRVGPIDHKVGISQSFPWFGTLSLKEEIANIRASAAHYAFLSKKNYLISNVIKSFLELSYLHSAYKITQSNLDLLKKMEEVVAQRYRSAHGNQSNLIKIQLELGKLEDKLREIKSLEEPLRAEFNALLNRDVASSINLINLSELVDTKNYLYTKNISTLEKILEDHNPEIQLLKTLSKANKEGVELAKKDFYPSFSIGVDYTFIGERQQAGTESGNDGIAAMLSFNLPFNYIKNNAALNEARFKSNSSQKNLKSSTFRLKASLSKVLFYVRDSKRKVALYKTTLVPKAEEGLEVAFTNFESGSISFLDLLDTERELLNFKLELSRSIADFVIYLSKLRSLLGDYSSFESNNKEKF